MYTFLETALVTLALLPHFIAFFSDVEEDSGSPGKLAATFLGFGQLLASQIAFGFIFEEVNCCDWVVYSNALLYSVELSIFPQCARVLNHARITSGRKQYNY